MTDAHKTNIEPSPEEHEHILTRTGMIYNHILREEIVGKLEKLKCTKCALEVYLPVE